MINLKKDAKDDISKVPTKPLKADGLAAQSIQEAIPVPAVIISVEDSDNHAQDDPDLVVIEGEIVEEEENATSSPFYRKQVPLGWGMIALVCALLLSGIISYIFLPLLFASATITIFPDERSVTAVFSLPLAGVHELRPVTLSEVKRVNATGVGYQEATPSQGYVTLYNAAPYTQVVPVGTHLIGADGVSVVTKQTAYIPAGNFSTNGQITVSAQSAVGGSNTNIAAYDIDGSCCLANVFVRNNAPFSGGMDAYTYRYITNEDIANAAASLFPPTQVMAKRELFGYASVSMGVSSPLCSQKFATDMKAGDIAPWVTVHMAVTCSAYSFDKIALQNAVTVSFTAREEAVAPTFRLSKESLYFTVASFGTWRSRYGATIQARGIFIYTFRKSMIAAMKNLVAGRGHSEAIALLLNERGVKSVQITQWLSTTLPTNPSAITILVEAGGLKESLEAVSISNTPSFKNIPLNIMEGKLSSFFFFDEVIERIYNRIRSFQTRTALFFLYCNVCCL
jgi:hypothetical protein